MATSESDDFESADEGFDADDSPKKSKISGVTTGVQKLGPAAETKETSVEESKNVKPVEVSEEGGWEPDDLDDDILYSIEESNIEEVTKAVNDLKVEPAEEQQLPVTETPTVPTTAETKTETSETPNEVQQKERRQRPIREAKNIGKLGSGGAKKLGSKLSGSSAAANKVTEDVPDNFKEFIKESERKEEAEEKKPVEVASVLDKLAASSEEPQQQASGWGAWGGWGSSLLTTATSSVTSLGSQVINTVIDTVESGLGAPNPEEIAREQIAETVKEPLINPNEEEKTADGGDQTNISFPLGSWISGVSQLGKIVESTGSKVISGGLDTLENIGKKTMQVLQDGDPGLKKKRALFQPDKPVLSQALREAKELAEQHEQAAEEKIAARKVHFETLFDDFQGLVHLEALEMLSRQCEMKLQSSLLKLAGAELKEAHEKLVAVRDESILPSTDDIEEPEGDISEAVLENIQSLPVKVSSDKLLKIWNSLQSLSTRDATLADDHAHCISSLAELTSACVEVFHRTGELLTVNETRDPLTEAQALQKLTINLTFLVEKSATLLCENLNQKHGEDAQIIITKVFLEASNSSTYIQDAFQLLMPVLQQATLL
ncbi:protein FAM114A2 [Cloeon dipterum]|uniref:protein FAM114A2 n=1 Tax=Cloeon dipterum TaxID=197152 RepID=UPI00321FD099